MKQTVKKYADMFRELQISDEVLTQTSGIFSVVPQVKEMLADPSVSLSKKHDIIEKVFPEKIRDVMKLLCDNQDIDLWDGIIEQQKEKSPEAEGCLDAVLTYVTAPSPEQMERIQAFLKKKYQVETVNIREKQDDSLGGGFKLQARTDEFDWSTKERIRQLEQKLENAAQKEHESTKEIITILKEEIEDFDLQVQGREIGFVTFVGDGIANVSGVDHAEYGEILLFDQGTKGMVQDMRRDEIGCFLFGREGEIKEGSRVVRTGKRAGIPVSENFLGRVVNALGAPIDGQGEIEASDYRPIEAKAPGITQRKSVGVPLETGIMAIDSMFPIGRGQRDLIIGDRQTGKTSIAVDTILNQKGKNVICIYVAVGQKASTVAKMVNTLKKWGAMDYSVVVSSTASDPASLQYIAPYVGTSLAEYFMYRGRMY